jgi:hypothetical protein
MRRALPLLAVLVAGCPPNPFPEDNLPTWEERPVEASYDENTDAVWDATITVFGDLYPIDTIDRDGGRIVTEWVIGTSDYIYNVFSGTRVPEKVRFRMVVEVGTKSGRTMVRVRSHEQVEKDIISANLDFTGSIYEWIDVPSSCKKERGALERIAARLDQRAGRGADVDLRR